MTIRKAEIEDLNTITDIYNKSVLNSIATFDIEPRTLESQLEWFNDHDEKYSIFVYEVEEKIVGWASLSLFSEKKAYDRTTEISIYVDDDYKGIGVGDSLMKTILKHAKNSQVHTIIARIAGDNQVSIYLHEKYDFKYIGTLREVGYKFNTFIDVHLFQLIIS